MNKQVDYKNPKVALKEYEAYKRLTVKTEKINDVLFYAKKFLDHVGKDLDKLEEKDIISFLNMIDKSYGVGTQNMIKVNLKNFLKWNYPSWSSDFRNITALCRSMKTEKRYTPEDMLSIKDIEKLVKTEKDPKWKAFIMVLFYSGCRPIEIMRLKWKEINFEKDGAFINISSNKNHEKFQKYVPEQVSFYLKRLQGNNSEFVFPSPISKDRIMHKKTFALKMRTLSVEALGRKVNPYLLRHSVATILYNRDDIKDEDVAKQMGHNKSMRNTYDNLSKDKVRAKMRRMWIQPEELPEEKKRELELEIEELKGTMDLKIRKAIDEYMESFADQIHLNAEKYARQKLKPIEVKVK